MVQRMLNDLSGEELRQVSVTDEVEDIPSELQTEIRSFIYECFQLPMSEEPSSELIELRLAVREELRMNGLSAEEIDCFLRGTEAMMTEADFVEFTFGESQGGVSERIAYRGRILFFDCLEAEDSFFTR